MKKLLFLIGAVVLATYLTKKTKHEVSVLSYSYDDVNFTLDEEFYN